jgi:hypothetical protein
MLPASQAYFASATGVCDSDARVGKDADNVPTAMRQKVRMSHSFFPFTNASSVAQASKRWMSRQRVTNLSKYANANRDATALVNPAVRGLPRGRAS